MRSSSARAGFVVSLLASVVIAGCGGPQKEAQAPETNPWADYKGTFAQPAEPAPAVATAVAPKPDPNADATATAAPDKAKKGGAKRGGKAVAKKAVTPPRAKS